MHNMHSTLKHSVYYMSKMLTFLFLLSLIFCSILPEMEARRLHSDHKDGEKFAFGSMMSSGPSKGGAGHKRLKHFEIFRVSKDSGPSPGVGHK